MTKEQYEKIGYQDSYQYREEAEKFLSKPYRLLEFQWFMSHTPFGEEEINFLKNKFNISNELLDFIKFEIHKTPSWIIRLANGLNDNYNDKDLGFKDYIDKKEGFHKICKNCAFYNSEIEWCNKGEGHFTNPNFWRLCSKKEK